MEPASGETAYEAVWQYRFRKSSSVDSSEKATSEVSMGPKYEYRLAFSSESNKSSKSS